MAKKTAANKVRMLYQSRAIKIYKKGRRVIFSYVDRSNDEDGSNDSFSQAVNVSVFKNAIIELLRTRSCNLSKCLKLELDQSGEKLTIEHSISDHQTFFLTIRNFNFGGLFF